MVLNRMKDANQSPHDKNFLKLNIAKIIDNK